MGTWTKEVVMNRKCPYCGSTKVVRSHLEEKDDVAWRLCACEGCGKVYTESFRFEYLGAEEVGRRSQ